MSDYKSVVAKMNPLAFKEELQRVQITLDLTMAILSLAEEGLYSDKEFRSLFPAIQEMIDKVDAQWLILGEELLKRLKKAK